MPAKKTINQKDLAEIISLKKDINLGKKQIEKIIKVLYDVIIDELKNGHTVKITSFGTFTPKNRYARGGVNPQNPTERIKIPAVKITKFKTGKKLKDALKK
ncbi:MAG TPA: HU family DNA-binding protein [bacterium]|nr:HU family DNA-binding protein [bacterium]